MIRFKAIWQVGKEDMQWFLYTLVFKIDTCSCMWIKFCEINCNLARVGEERPNVGSRTVLRPLLDLLAVALAFPADFITPDRPCLCF